MALITLCIVLAACSSEDDTVSEPKKVLEAGKTYSMTVNASKGGGTSRALSLSGSTLNASWATTEDVYFCDRGDIYFTGSLRPQTGGELETTLNGSITCSHTLTLPLALTLIFPRKDWDYTVQRGTIADIAANYDYMTAPINLSELTTSGIGASTSVAFTSQQAIVKFTLQDKNNGDAAINATSLRISASGLAQSVDVVHDGDAYTFTNTPGDITVTPASETSDIWVALRGISGKPVRLTASDGTNTYVYSRNNVTFNHGQYYERIVKMKKITEGTELSAVTSDYIGCVVGQDGRVYSTPAKATAASTTAVAMIAYVGSESNCTHGLAIALADENKTMTQSAASTAASGKTSVSGGAWRLPTLQDWQYMLIGCGNGATYSATPETVDATALTSKLATLGAALTSTATYWSSVVYIAPNFEGTTVNLSFSDALNDGLSPYYVRACLAF